MEINYSEKINTFKLLIDYNDDDLALDFLERANWDEEKAANLYNKEMNSQKKQSLSEFQKKKKNFMISTVFRRYQW